jgi:hypothetical protein
MVLLHRDKPEDASNYFELVESAALAKANAEVKELRGYLQTAIGHSNCYCEKCKDIQAFWTPTLSEVQK